MGLINSDEYSASQGEGLRAYGRSITPLRTVRPGRPEAPYAGPGLEVRRCGEDPAGGARGQSELPGGLRLEAGGALGVGRLAGQSCDGHGVRGAVERYSPASKRPGGPHDLLPLN